MTELLKALCLLDGVPGWEDEVRDFIRGRAEGLGADEIREDRMGNLLVFKRGRRRTEKPVMLMAHMDEVGLLCKSVTDDGYLRFVPAGGVDPRVLPGRKVRAGKDKIPGVIGMKPIHLTQPEERGAAVKVKSMYVDIGAADKAGALAKISPGDPIYFDGSPLEMDGGFLRAKAIDDRVGCCVLLTMLSREQDIDCWYVFTVREEIGTRGAFGAAHGINPGVAIAVEGTTAADRPDMDGHKKVCVPGGGVVVPFMDGGTFYDRGLFLLLRGIAEEEGIPWQTKEFVSGGTDASAVQRTRAGVRVAGIAAAVRYIHSPSSVMKLEDMYLMERLASAFLTRWEGE